MIDGSDNIVFFGGAGVSTESGIPDFRGTDGLYNKTYDYPPEEILSLRFFAANFRAFYDFYRDKMIQLDAKPNAAHLELARLERIGKLKAVITQNIDGLHYAAGSKNVFEIHGSVHRNYCLRCHKCHSAEYVKSFDTAPGCSDCGGLIKPDVVLYGENLNTKITEGAIEAIKNADMLIVGGTSLTVYPAASLIDYYRGNKLVLINKTPTDFDENVDLLINGSIGEALTFHITPVAELPPKEISAPPPKPTESVGKPEKAAEISETIKPSETAEIPEKTVEITENSPEFVPETPPAKPPRKPRKKAENSGKTQKKSENADTSDDTKAEKPPKKPRKPRKKKEEENVSA
jgi:NAD-dependent deacetylase